MWQKDLAVYYTGAEYKEEDWKAFLSPLLPEYMVPAFYTQLWSKGSGRPVLFLWSAGALCPGGRGGRDGDEKDHVRASGAVPGIPVGVDKLMDHLPGIQLSGKKQRPRKDKTAQSGRDLHDLIIPDLSRFITIHESPASLTKALRSTSQRRSWHVMVSRM